MECSYFPIPLKGILIDTAPDFDLFIMQKNVYVLYRKADTPFSKEIVRNLIDSNIANLFVKNDDLKRYEEYRGRVLEGKPGKTGMLPYEGIYADPVEVERYYNVTENFHSVNRNIFIRGVQIDFPLFYRDVNNVLPVPECEQRQEGPWTLSGAAVTEERELMIRNEDLDGYQKLIENMMTAVYGDNGGNGKKVERKALLLREMSKATVQNLLNDPKSGENLKAMEKITNDSVEFILENEVLFYSLMRIQAHDFYTYVHSINSSTFSVGLGLAIKLPKKPDLELLALGGALHDVGKCQVDSKIINKPGKLSLSEFKKMKNHVRLGIKLLKEHHQLPDTVIEIVSQHHERMTGAGYPLGLRGEQISLFGRIAAIVDTYDVLTTNRTYKKALKPFDALHVLSKTDGNFDQNLLRDFIALLGKQIEE